MFISDIRIAVLALSAAALIGLSAVIFLIRRKSSENQMFSVWLLLVAAWSVSLAAFFAVDDAQSAELWMRAAYATAILNIVQFFYFSLVFVRRITINPAIAVLDLACTIVFMGFIMLSPIIVTGVGAAPFQYSVHLNSGGWYAFALYLLVHFLAAHMILFLKYLESTGSIRHHLKYVMGSVFVGGEVFGVLFNLILPSPLLRNWSLIWLGPTLSAAFITPFIAYAITQHKLFNVRGVITEIVVFFSIFFVAIDALMSESSSDLAVRGILALVVVSLGIVLIRRVRVEERQRQELQKLSAQLASVNKKLEERDRMRSEFISIASHQLRTPVSVVKGYLSLMLDGTFGKIPKKIQDKMRLMFDMNERLVMLINNMLSMSRIERNRIEFGYGTTNVTDLAQSAIREMSFKAEQKKLKLSLRPMSVEIPTVETDAEKIKEVMVNLVDNAIKYTEKGKVEMAIDVDQKKKCVVVSVSDTGYGMTKEIRDHIFHKFYRGENANVPKESGTGLGLFIATKFIRGMGGDVWVADTAVGKGSTFRFTVPFKPKKK